MCAGSHVRPKCGCLCICFACGRFGSVVPSTLGGVCSLHWASLVHGLWDNSYEEPDRCTVRGSGYNDPSPVLLNETDVFGPLADVNFRASQSTNYGVTFVCDEAAGRGMPDPIGALKRVPAPDDDYTLAFVQTEWRTVHGCPIEVVDPSGAVVYTRPRGE